jgi:hypothetical protein
MEQQDLHGYAPYSQPGWWTNPHRRRPISRLQNAEIDTIIVPGALDMGPACGDWPRRGSVLRNDGPAEFVVEAQRHDRIGAVDGVGQHAGGGSSANESAEIVVSIFELADQVVGDRVGDTATGRQAASLNRELLGAESGNEVGMTQKAQCPAAVEEQQHTVNGDAASGAKRGAILELGRVDCENRKGAGVKLTSIATLDAGPEPIGFDADHDVAALRVVADLAAANGTGRVIIDRKVRKAGRAQRVVEIVIAEAAGDIRPSTPSETVVKRIRFIVIPYRTVLTKRLTA